MVTEQKKKKKNRCLKYWTSRKRGRRSRITVRILKWLEWALDSSGLFLVIGGTGGATAALASSIETKLFLWLNRFFSSRVSKNEHNDLTVGFYKEKKNLNFEIFLGLTKFEVWVPSPWAHQLFIIFISPSLILKSISTFLFLFSIW